MKKRNKIFIDLHLERFIGLTYNLWAQLRILEDLSIKKKFCGPPLTYLVCRPAMAKPGKSTKLEIQLTLEVSRVALVLEMASTSTSNSNPRTSRVGRT